MKQTFIVLTMFLLFSCTTKNKNFISLRGEALGTTYSIKYEDIKKRNFSKKISHLIDITNHSISTYIPNSAISKVNQGDSSVKVDSIFEEVFTKAKKIHLETNGFFDPTVGNLVNAWGFGAKKAPKNIDSLIQFVGFDKVQLANKKIHFKVKGIYLDFNAIGKGYFIDLIGRMFEQNGIQNYMIEVGGEIRARGVNSQKKPWRIGVQNPHIEEKEYKKIISLSNQSMATSGNYRKFYINDKGEKYVHTVNPKTGMATESSLLSATVIASSDCADVDAYATAFMAMGLEKTLLFLKKHPELKVVLIYSDNNSTNLKTYTTVE